MTAETGKAPATEGGGRLIPGYGDKYVLFATGELHRRTSHGYVPVAQFDDPPRVTLYRFGARWRPRVSELLARVFGELPGD